MEMVNVVKQEVGTSKWNEMIERRPKRTMELLLVGLSILDKWNRDNRKYGEGVRTVRVW